jgi:flagellar motor switch protein FliN/FliY
MVTMTAQEIPVSQPVAPAPSNEASIAASLRDVELTVRIELGRTRMLLEDVLKLRDGAVVELDKLVDEPVDLYVNDRLIARGEVVVADDQFGVRVTEIVRVGSDREEP